MPTNEINGTERPGLITNIDPSLLSKVMGCDYSANMIFKTYQDGVLVHTDTTQAAVSSPDTPVQFVFTNNIYEVPREALIDNIIVSTDFDRDLYALRNSTSKPSGDDIVFYWRCDGSSETGIEWDDEHDYASGSPSIVHWDSDGSPISYNTSDYVVGNSSGQISYKSGQDFNCDGFAVTDVTNLPTIKGRMGYWVKFIKTSDDANYYHIGLSRGFMRGGWQGDPETFCGLSYTQSSEDPHNYIPTTFSFHSEGYDSIYMVMANSGIGCPPGTWCFIELAFNFAGVE